ncbi:SCUBE3 [Symbiodinium sp. CCMP2456]|nr:SCUBE3 [Symbiodinium sp. CCMP2456]
MMYTALQILLLARASAATQCLPSAVPPNERKYLQGRSGQFPLGLCPNGNPQDVVVTTAVQILVEEVLGIHAVVYPLTSSTAGVDDFYQLAGCEANASEWVCTGRSSKHVMLGILMVGREPQLAEVQRLRVGGILDRMSMGFGLFQGIYIPQTLLAKAFDSQGLALEYYRSYSLANSWKSFSRIWEVNESDLVSCWDWGTFDRFAIEKYVNITGDESGVRVDAAGVTRAQCHHEYWWFAPTCRQNSSECIPLISCHSWGYNWYASEIMFKATTWSMPIATGAGRGCDASDSFWRLPFQHDVLLYYWSPDVMFNSLHLQPVAFPAFNSRQWLMGDMSTLRSVTEFENFLHKDLATWAPEVESFLSAMSWQVGDVNTLLSLVDSGNVPDTAHHAACSWLRDNEVAWQNWVPMKSRCLAGHGMYSVEKQSFISIRDQNTSCRPCPPGMYSALIQDDIGDTAECQPCLPGTLQSSYAAVTCDVCLPGTFTGRFGSTICEKCPQGEYQEQEGKTDCRTCGPFQTTIILGASSIGDCACTPGSFWQDVTGDCEPCIDGMSCSGGATRPQQLQGFWAEELEDAGRLSYSVFSCHPRDHCPEGLPGKCAQNRVGRACAACQLGYTPAADGGCVDCEGHIFLPWLLVVVVLGTLYLLHTCGARRRQTATTLLIILVMSGQGVICMQNLHVVSQLEIEWMEPVAALLSFISSLVSLDLQDMGFHCFAPDYGPAAIYLLQALAYPCIILVTVVPWVLARLIRRPISFQPIFSLHGLVLVSLFTSITLVFLQPFECRKNPNGTSTVVAYAQVICWETEEHLWLICFACLGILAYPASMFAGMGYVTWVYAAKMTSRDGIKVVERYRFLFGRFRADRYQYCLLLTAANLLCGCIPSAFSTLQALQVWAFGSILLTRIAILCLLWPWRLNGANWSELLLIGATLVVLLLAAPLVTVDNDANKEIIAVMLMCILCFVPGIVSVAAAISIGLRVCASQRYSMFLSHHKAGAGALCRYVKIVLMQITRAKIFYDSDNLRDLGTLFDTVKTKSDLVLAVITSDFIRSLWCVGEISTAFVHGVPTMVLCCDGCGIPDYDELRTIDSWPDDHWQMLTGYGISSEDVRAAFAFLYRVEVFHIQRTSSSAEQERAVLQLAAAAKICPERFVPEVSVEEARILVASGMGGELISSSLVLQQLLQLKLQLEICHVFQPHDFAICRASAIVIVVGRGCLQEQNFCQLLLALPPSWDRVLVSDGTFEFPSPGFYSEVRAGCMGLPGDPLVVVEMYRSLCSNIALPLSPHSSSSLLDRQVDQICEQIRDVSKDQEVSFLRSPSGLWKESSSVAFMSRSMPVEGGEEPPSRKSSLSSQQEEDSRELDEEEEDHVQVVF